MTPPLLPDGDVIGQVLNDTYQITAKIARGGMGTIYEAINTRLTQKRYAIKLLRAELTADADTAARFRREAEVVASLGHKNIVEVLDFNQTEWGLPYIVMERLVGQTLDDRLKQDGTLPPLGLVQIMAQVGDALRAAHAKGIVHRDMKPENIFLVDEGGGRRTVKVLDFGVSKMHDGSSIVTAESMLLGTLHYMSPEQAAGYHREVDGTTDIFALGAICYQCLSGQRPFEGPNIPALLYKIINEPHAPLYAIAPDLPPALSAVLDKAMAKDKLQRFQRVEAFLEALMRSLSGSTPRPPGGGGGGQRTQPSGSGGWGRR